MEYVVIIWILCAITSAVIASGKGRSGFGWFCIGLIAGVFALIMIICLPKLEADPNKRPPNEGAYG